MFGKKPQRRQVGNEIGGTEVNERKNLKQPGLVKE